MLLAITRSGVIIKDCSCTNNASSKQGGGGDGSISLEVEMRHTNNESPSQLISAALCLHVWLL